MDLVVVTVSYNTRDLLDECLESTLAGVRRSKLTAEVWVVDNASSDGSAAMVRRGYPSVKLIAHDENIGFAGGNNLALRQMGFGREMRPSYVLFLNPDTRIVGEALGVMVDFLDRTPTAGAAGAQLLHSDGGFQHSAFMFPGLAQIFLDFFPLHPRLLDSRLNGRYPRRLYKAGRPFPVDHPLGAALMVRGETLARVGSFDERFFMYCEEIDLCRRIRMEGSEIYCVPKAKIVHHVAQSTKQFRDRMFVALWRSRFLMFERYESRPFCWAARRLVRLGLRAAAREAVAAHQRGECGASDLEKSLAAFREVASL